MPRPRLWILLVLALLCVLFRLGAFPANIALLGGFAFFLGALVPNLWLGIGIALGTRLIMDAAVAIQVGNSGMLLYSSLPFVLLATFLYVLCGRGVRGLLRARQPRHIGNVMSNAAFAAGGGLLGAVSFFVVSNFGAWLTLPLYAKTMDGLMLCYANAIPFFRFEADVVSSVVLVTGFCTAAAFVSERTRSAFAVE